MCRVSAMHQHGPGLYQGKRWLKSFRYMLQPAVMAAEPAQVGKRQMKKAISISEIVSVPPFSWRAWNRACGSC